MMNGRCEPWAMTTSSDRVEGQRAYVLHTRPFKETSYLVDYLTPDFGRIRVVVKGARRAKSRLRQAVQPFLPLDISWRGHSDLKTLTAGEPVAINPFLRGRSLWCGLYLNELVMRMLPAWDSCPRLFAYYRLALGSLDDLEAREAVLRVFERRLLEELGFAVSFTHTGDDQRAIVASGYYHFDPQLGFSAATLNGADSRAGENSAVEQRRLEDGEPGAPGCANRRVQEDCNPATGGGRYRAIAESRPLFPGEALLAIGGDDYSAPGTRQVAKVLMRCALKPHLGGKPLQSRELFRASQAGVEGKPFAQQATGDRSAQGAGDRR